MEHKGDLHPQIVIEDERGKILEVHYIPERAYLEVRDDEQVSAGSMLAKTPREVGGTQDITGGLPRVTEIFEARRPRDPAVMAEIAGRVRLGETNARANAPIIIEAVDDNGKSTGGEVEHLVPHGKQLRVHTDDYVKAGDAARRRPAGAARHPRISGVEAVQKYLVREVQAVYRSQRVEIDDKHIEIIVSQMLRKVKVETMGDTGLLPGLGHRQVRLPRGQRSAASECVKIKDPGESKFEPGKIVSEGRLRGSEASPSKWTARRRRRSRRRRRRPAATQLLGITKAAVQSDSFISAASFQETTKVLTEAALAGKVDYLVGLKENVILGHLIPAGTGFNMHQEAEVRIHPNALDSQMPMPEEEPAEVAPE